MENLDLLNNDLQVSSNVKSYLSESAKWGKFLSVLGFILCGILVMVAFILPSVLSKIPPYNSVPAGFSSSMQAGLTIIYLLGGVILFFPCYYLFKFSTNMQSAIKSENQENFDESLMNLKSIFKFYGILTIVILSFYALVFIIAMLGLAMKG